MAVHGSQITLPVYDTVTVSPVAGAVINVDPPVYLDAKFAHSVTALTSTANGVVSCYAYPGVYLFAPTDGNVSCESVVSVATADVGDSSVTPFVQSVTQLLAGKQPLDADLTAIAALSTTPYGRALLTMANAAAVKAGLSLVKGDVGLGSVDNTPDTAKPISTAQQSALNLKADLASPTFTGDPKAPTPSAGDNDTSIATTSFVKGAVDGALAGTWAAPSPLGTSKRSPNIILMSTYDTNAASTDHTAAFQSALAAAAAIIAGGGPKSVWIILDSRQVYTIAGSVQAGADGQWAQIPLPYDAVNRGDIKLVGMPRGSDFTIYSNRSGTTIRSTLAAAPTYSASVGIASIFGGPASYCTSHIGGTSVMSRIGFGVQDVTIRAAAPNICGIDAGFQDGFEWDGLLQFDTDWSANAGTITLNTGPQAIPLITPLLGCGVGTVGDTLCVVGWTCGPVLGDNVSVQRYIAFANPGAILNVDASDQVARFDHVIDWGNGYGIAAAVPTSATPISPTAVGAASGTTYPGVGPTAVHIGSWNIQTTGGGPGGAARVYDVMDANAIQNIYALFDSTTYAFTQLGVLILGAGPALNGLAGRIRIINTRQFAGPFVAFAPAVPASGVAIRNPFGVPALVTISGGSVSNIAVQTVTVPSGVILLPANAIISLTYSVAPTWNWQAI